MNSQIQKLLPEISTLKNLEVLDLFNCGLIEYAPEACVFSKLRRFLFPQLILITMQT